MKEHRERRERDLAIAAVAGDEQRMRAAYAERIGAGERRRSRAAKVWTALAHARGVCWSAPSLEQSSCCAARRRHRLALVPIGRAQHGQGCCWHVERTGEERVRKSAFVLPFSKREVPPGPRTSYYLLKNLGAATLRVVPYFTL